MTQEVHHAREERPPCISSMRQAKLSRGKAHYLVYAVDHVLDVALVQASEGNTTRLQQVDVMLLNQALALRRCQARKREHSDLVGDVVPCSRCAFLFQALPQQSSNLEDAVRHGGKLPLPGLQTSWIAEDV